MYWNWNYFFIGLFSSLLTNFFFKMFKKIRDRKNVKKESCEDYV